MPDYIATTGAVMFTLYAAHLLGDHVLQRHEWAITKGLNGHDARMACAAHVATLTLTQLIALALLAVTTSTALHPVGVLAGLGINAWSHYWADRREPFRALCSALGKTVFYHAGCGIFRGAYRMDQDFHTAWIVPVALIIAAPSLAHVAALTVASAAVMAAAITVSRHRRARERAETAPVA